MRRTRHRYHLYRRISLSTTLVVLFAVPLLHLARFDLWKGRHQALFQRVGPIDGFIAVILALMAFYGVTFLINLIAGRMFCGWGCPIG